MCLESNATQKRACKQIMGPLSKHFGWSVRKRLHSPPYSVHIIKMLLIIFFCVVKIFFPDNFAMCSQMTFRRRSDGLFLQCCREAAEKNKDVRYNEMYLDTTCLKVSLNGAAFDCIATFLAVTSLFWLIKPVLCTGQSTLHVL